MALQRLTNNTMILISYRPNPVLRPLYLYKNKMLIVYLVVLIGTTISTFIVNFVECRPFALNWDASIPGTCIDRNAFYIWTSIPNIATDIAILILPMRVVWNLHASMRTKVSNMRRKDHLTHKTSRH